MGKNMKQEKDLIFKMVPTNIYMTLRCDICGGWTNGDGVLCQAWAGEEELLACQQCVKNGAADELIEKNVKRLRDLALFFESLLGRVVLPSNEEWEKAVVEREAEVRRVRAAEEV